MKKILEKFGMVVSDSDDDDSKDEEKSRCKLSTFQLLEELSKKKHAFRSSKKKESKLRQICGMTALELLGDIKEEIEDPSMEEVHKIANLSKPSTSRKCDDFSGLSSLEIFEELKKHHLEPYIEKLNETANSSKRCVDLTEIFENEYIENMDISESPTSIRDYIINWHYNNLLDNAIVPDFFPSDEERSEDSYVINPYFKKWPKERQSKVRKSMRPKRKRSKVRKPLLNTELKYNKLSQFNQPLANSGLEDIDSPFIKRDQENLPEDHPWFSWMNNDSLESLNDIFTVDRTSDIVDNREKNALSEAGSLQAQDTIRYTLPVSIDLNKLKRVPKKKK